MSDGGIGSGKYRRRRPPSSVVEDVFNCGSAPPSSDRGRHRHGLVASLPPLSSHGGALLDPDGDDNEDEDDDEDEGNDDCSRQERATEMWALCWGTSTITKTPMLWRSQAGLRQRQRHQQRGGGGGGQKDGGTTLRQIPEVKNHAPQLSSPLLRKRIVCRHRRRRRRDRDRGQ